MEARMNGVNKITIASASFTNYYDKTEIDELLGAKQQLYVTQEEYNNLSDEEKLNDNVVFIPLSLFVKILSFGLTFTDKIPKSLRTMVLPSMFTSTYVPSSFNVLMLIVLYSVLI